MNKVYLDILVKCPIVLPKFGFSQKIFTEVPSIKFYENPTGGSQADTCEQTDTWTDNTHDKAKTCLS
jgi:hypothetical protein